MDTREKYKLSIGDREELTKIAMHEGWDKAFHRLMEIAVEPEEVIENPLLFNFELQAKKWFEELQTSITTYIGVIERRDAYSNKVVEMECSEHPDLNILGQLRCYVNERDEWLKRASSDPDYVKITETLKNFDFSELFDKVTTLYSASNLICPIKKEDLIRDAIYVLVAAKDFWNEEHKGNIFCIGNMHAIVVPDEDTCFYKLIYSLEESTVEW